MKLIIIGASSFIGQNLYLEAKSRGYDVIGTQYSSNHREFIKLNLLTQKLSDVIPSKFINSSCKKFAVICSAVPKIDRCYLEGDVSYKLNVVKTIELVKELNNLGAKVAFLSTEAVYDGERGYYDESVPPSPINHYGLQKVEVENFINSFDPGSLIFRLSMVVSDKPNEKHLFSDWYQKAADTGYIECIKGQIFSPTYVKDVAQGILCSIEKDLGGLYHLTNSEYFLRGELARQFLRITNIHGEVVEKPLEDFNFIQKRSMRTYLDGAKFVRDTGFGFLSMKEVIRKFGDNLRKGMSVNL
ncbi:MAG: SDR family oxidoreductase [Bacillota bacterium]